MQKRSLQKIIASIFAACLLATFAHAQKTGALSSISPHLTYNGTEISTGNLDPISGINYGDTFVLNGSAEWTTRYLTVSINTESALHGTLVSGGSWSLVVFAPEGYLGTLYGVVIGGDVQNVVDDNGKVIGKISRVNLVAIGGSGPFDKSQPFPRTSNLELTTDFRSLQTTGSGLLEF